MTRLHDFIGEAIAYWESLCEGSGAPLRVAFDPVDIPRLLPYIVFFDVLDGGRDFRFRVIGEKVRSVFFENYTGRKLLSLAHVEPDGPLVGTFRKAVASRVPVREPVEYVGPDSEVVKHDEVVLPFANRAGAVTHLAVIMILSQRRYRTGRT